MLSITYSAIVCLNVFTSYNKNYFNTSQKRLEIT